MSKKIMVVDDEPDILTTVGQMLEMSGFEVIRAASGKECIKKLTQSSANPDLIVLDIMMPEVSGWDVAAKIKENPRWNKIPIVFLTAKGDVMSIGMGGMTSEDYIVKPFDIKDLIERVKKILENY
ncbi:chemotaxis protein CheY [Thermoplasmatales archaeon SG8-52-4]|nr:MAG: chemotaxis protein CheY [Thermoplasmatales archaeon SG8-52-4]